MSQEKHKSQRSETKLIGEARIAYAFLHKRREKSAGGAKLDKPRYDAVVLVPKKHSDAAQCPNYKMLADMCVEAATKAWGSFPQGGKWPIQDGDVPHTPKPKPGVAPLTPEQIAERNKWRVGHWVIEVTNYNDPGPRVCVMQNGVATDIPAQTIGGVQVWKSGDYGFVSANAYTFHNQTFGVNFGFEGVLFTRPGEAIGSSGPRSAAAMFGSVAGTVVGQAPAMPAPGVPPMPSAAPAAPQGYAPPPQAPVAAPALAPTAPQAAPMPPAPPAPQYSGAPQYAGQAPGAAPAAPQYAAPAPAAPAPLPPMPAPR